VSTMLVTSFAKGSTMGVDRAVASIIIASELQRLGLSETGVYERLIAWNSRNEPPRSEKEIQNVVQSAFAKDYMYGCQHVSLKMFCQDPEFQWCNFCPAQKRKLYYYNINEFLKYGWQDRLSQRAFKVYTIALPTLELRKGCRPGGQLFASHREIAKLAKMSLCRVGETLVELEDNGLLEYYSPGIPRCWEKRASAMKRELPIPLPPPT